MKIEVSGDRVIGSGEVNGVPVCSAVLLHRHIDEARARQMLQEWWDGLNA